MDKNNTDPDNALVWAQAEYKADSSYWRDRAKNGIGLIREIADFVLKQAGAQR